MRENREIVRESMGCGYLPRTDRVHLTIWRHEGYEGPAPTVCPGYSTKLPEVADASRARLHWSKGSLSVATRGKQPTEALVTAIEVLDTEASRLESWILSQRKGG